MKLHVELGDDPHETLTTLHKAYSSVEQLSHCQGVSSKDIHCIMYILNSCLGDAVKRLPKQTIPVLGKVA